MKLYIPMFALLLILSSSMVSAFVGFDPVKNYDSATQEVTVSNSFLFIPTSEIGTVTLINNTASCGGSIQCEATINLSLSQDYTSPLERVDITEPDKVTPYTIDGLQVYIKNGTQEVQVPDYGTICGERPNPVTGILNPECWNNQTGSHTATEDTFRVFNVGETLPAGDYEFKIVGEKDPSITVEWIPTFLGFKINEWDTWGPTVLRQTVGTSTTASQNNFGANYPAAVMFNSTAQNYTLQIVQFYVAACGGNCGGNTVLTLYKSNRTDFSGGSFSLVPGQIGENSSTVAISTTGYYNFTFTNNVTNVTYGQMYWLIAWTTSTGSNYFRLGETTSVGIKTWGYSNTHDTAGMAQQGADIDTMNVQLWGANLTGGGGGGGSPLSMVVNLNIPANNSVTGNISMAFNTNATVTNGNLTNVTLYVQNSGLFTNFTTVTGASNITLLSKSGIANGVKYNWTVQYCAQNSTTVLCQYAPANFTFTGNFGTPNVSIKFPTNTTYNTPGPTGINITTSPDVTTCWYSINNWATNTTFTCASNVSGLVANNGSNTWMVGVNNSAGSLNMTNVTFAVIVPFNLTVSLTTPPDSSTTTSSALTFNSSATVFSGNLVNATLYVWNGSMQFTNLTSVTGNSTNTTSIGKGNLSTGSYTWNVQYCAQNSSNTLCVFGVNRTFTEVSAPTLALTQVCHQEFTNRTPSCVGYGNGTYTNANPVTINGIWSDLGPAPANMLINYTLAPGALNDSLWEIQPIDAGGNKYIYNLSITSDCWNQAQLSGQLNFKANSGTYSCFNGAGYTTLFTAPEVGMSEDAMNWSISILKENSQTFTPSVPALTNNAFLANITWNKVYWTGINAVLTYNNTVYQGTLTNVGPDTILNASVVTPSTSSAVVVPFYWTVYLTNSSGTFAYNLTLETQTVGTISIDDCSANTLKILNLTMFDEDTNAYLNISNSSILNGTIAVTVRLYTPGNPTVYSSYSTTKSNTNPVFICLPAGNLTGVAYGMDADVQYSAGNRVTRWNYLRGYYLNATTAPDAIILRDLLTTESQEFKITYKDNTFLLVPNVVIDIEKYYVGQGFFATVENGLTDQYGTTIGHFVLGTNNYLINVYQNGNLVSSFPDIQPVCNNIAAGDCQINLQALTSAYQFTNWQTANNLNYNYNFNEAARQLTLTWALQNQLTGSSDVHLIVSVADVIGNQTACDIDSTGTFGVYTCNINQSFGNTTVAANLYKDGQFVSVNFFTITNGEQGTFGNTGLLLALVFVICLALMFTSSPTMAIVGGTFGLIVVGLLNLINMSNNTTGNSILAYSSGLVFIVVAATAIIYKINKSNGGIS